MCCGEPGVKGRSVVVELPSEAALAQFIQINCPPKDPAKFALKLLSVFFTDEELSQSNCTKAEGRDLLNQEILVAIKCEYMQYTFIKEYCTYIPSLLDQTNLKYPVGKDQAEARWQIIVQKSLNSKCRASRKKLRDKALDNQEN